MPKKPSRDGNRGPSLLQAMSPNLSLSVSCQIQLTDLMILSTSLRILPNFRCQPTLLTRWSPSQDLRTSKFFLLGAIKSEGSKVLKTLVRLSKSFGFHTTILRSSTYSHASPCTPSSWATTRSSLGKNWPKCRVFRTLKLFSLSVTPSTTISQQEKKQFQKLSRKFLRLRL